METHLLHRIQIVTLIALFAMLSGCSFAADTDVSNVEERRCSADSDCRSGEICGTDGFCLQTRPEDTTDAPDGDMTVDLNDDVVTDTMPDEDTDDLFDQSGDADMEGDIVLVETKLPPAPEGEAVSILILGNQRLDGEGLAQALSAMANYAGWPAPQIQFQEVADATLLTLSTHEGVLTAIDQAIWDYVIVAEDTITASSQASDPDVTIDGMTALYDRIQTSNSDAWVVVVEPWAFHPSSSVYDAVFNNVSSMTDDLAQTTRRTALGWVPSRSGAANPEQIATVAVGDAWLSYQLTPNSARTHEQDNESANTAGVYLTAATLYGAIYQYRSLGLSDASRGPTAAARMQFAADTASEATVVGGPGLGIGPASGGALRFDFGSQVTMLAGWVSDLREDSQVTDVLSTTSDLEVTINFQGLNPDGLAGNPFGWPPEVSMDTIWCGSFDGHDAGLANPAQLVISGLDPGAVYDVLVYASRAMADATGSRSTLYTLNSNTSQTLDATDNTTESVTFEDAAPLPDGTFVLDVEVDPQQSGRFCYLGALTVTRN